MVDFSDLKWSLVDIFRSGRVKALNNYSFSQEVNLLELNIPVEFDCSCLKAALVIYAIFNHFQNEACICIEQIV